MICLIDNKEFKTERGMINYIKSKYDLNYLTYQIRFGLLEASDYIRCEICGSYYQILKTHITKDHKDISFESYKELYNPKILVCDSIKTVMSNNVKGDKNPNHSSKTSQEYRKSNSPFCKEFWTSRDKEDLSKEVLDKAISNRSYTSRLDYWISRTNSLEEAKEKLKLRQTTFSLKTCISRYGINGKQVWSDRQTKWLNSLHLNGNLKLGYSKISQELFNSLPKSDNVYYAKLNKEYSLFDVENNKMYLYDYVDYDKKKIIEYNGDKYHANPAIYNSDDHPNPFNQLKSSDIWKYDSEKLEYARSHGFEVLIIWDSEYKSNKSFIVNTCISFLNNISL